MLETNFEMLTTVLGQKLQNDKKKIDFTCPLLSFSPISNVKDFKDFERRNFVLETPIFEHFRR
jgi:hypothetical protein